MALSPAAGSAWIKKVVEARGGADQEFSVSSIEQRTLAYDD